MASKEMVMYCFESLISHLKGENYGPKPLFDTSGEYPLFVTWEKETKDGEISLRGCIGTLAPTSLSNLRDYAFKSALQDRRFDPITLEEMPHLHCSVSLLTNYETAQSYLDWQVGVHGITIAFRDKHGNCYSATYLPEVANSQGWDQEETVVSLARKSGYRKHVSGELLQSMQVTRYQSSKCKLAYADFQKHLGRE